MRLAVNLSPRSGRERFYWGEEPPRRPGDAGPSSRTLRGLSRKPSRTGALCLARDERALLHGDLLPETWPRHVAPPLFREGTPPRPPHHAPERPQTRTGLRTSATERPRQRPPRRAATDGGGAAPEALGGAKRREASGAHGSRPPPEAQRGREDEPVQGTVRFSGQGGDGKSGRWRGIEDTLPAPRGGHEGGGEEDPHGGGTAATRLVRGGGGQARTGHRCTEPCAGDV